MSNYPPSDQPPGQPPYGGGGQQPPYGGGQPPYGEQPAYGSQPGKTNVKAIISLVLGILGLLCCGIFTGIPAIILARMAKNEIAQRGESGGGLATAGLVLGIIAVVFGILYLILILTGNFYVNFES